MKNRNWFGDILFPSIQTDYGKFNITLKIRWPKAEFWTRLINLWKLWVYVLSNKVLNYILSIHAFFIRTSKFWSRLVLNFLHNLSLDCSFKKCSYAFAIWGVLLRNIVIKLILFLQHRFIISLYTLRHCYKTRAAQFWFSSPLTQCFYLQKDLQWNELKRHM